MQPVRQQVDHVPADIWISTWSRGGRAAQLSGALQQRTLAHESPVQIWPSCWVTDVTVC